MNIIVIEDQKDQLEDMVANLEIVMDEITKKAQYSAIRYRIVPINTKKEAVTEDDDIEEFITKRLKQERPDILVIDYELIWGDYVSYDGDGVVKLVEDKMEISPFIILASSKFDSGLLPYPINLLRPGRIPPRAKVQLLKSNLTSEWSVDDEKKIAVQEILERAISYLNSESANVFEFTTFPFPKLKIRECDNMHKYRQTGKETKVVQYHKDEIVALLIGDQYTFSLLTYTDNELRIQCIHYSNNPRNSDLAQLYGLHTNNLKVLYNPNYLEYKENKYVFRLGFIESYETVREMKKLMKTELATADEIEMSFSSLALEMGNIFPFYSAFNRFDEVGL